MTYIDNPEEKEKIIEKIALLEQEHRDLDIMIDQANQGLNDLSGNNPNMASLAVQRGKKRKLLLKDQIIYLKSLLIPDIIA